jgi:preprotein translocase subunit SecB
MAENLFKALHAIQLQAVSTRELFICINGPVDDAVITACGDQVQLDSAHGDFNKEDRTINVGLRLMLGMDENNDFPISMRIEIVGSFTVDTDQFDEGNIESWATRNAPMILYPFVREHWCALTIRCGLPQMILPLIQVPTLTI